MATAAELKWDRDSWEGEFGKRRPVQMSLDAVNWQLGVVLSFDTQADIDAARPNYQTTVRRDGSINFVDQMERQYEVYGGLQRVLRILTQHGVKATFPTCGMTAEWYPEQVSRIVEEGHEIAVHSYSHWQMQTFSQDDLRREVELATTAIEKVAGRPPRGWRSPMYSTTGSTLDVLITMGYEWDASYPNADLPYLIDRPTGSILAIPSCLDDSNMYLMPVSTYTTHAGGNFYASPQNVLNCWQAEFDILYREAASEPRLFVLTLHPRVSGRPFRSWALDQLIAYIKRHEGTRFFTCSELAQECARSSSAPL